MAAEEQLQKATSEIKYQIKSALLERNMTQADLAKLLNVSRVTLNYAVSGGARPADMELRRKIYKILNIH